MIRQLILGRAFSCPAVLCLASALAEQKLQCSSAFLLAVQLIATGNYPGTYKVQTEALQKLGICLVLEDVSTLFHDFRYPCT